MFGGYDGGRELGPVVSTELVFLKVFARQLEVGEPRQVLVELLRRRSKLETAECRRRRRERLETERFVAGIVEPVERGRRVSGLVILVGVRRVTGQRPERRLVVAPERSDGGLERLERLRFERVERRSERFRSHRALEADGRFCGVDLLSLSTGNSCMTNTIFVSAICMYKSVVIWIYKGRRGVFKGGQRTRATPLSFTVFIQLF